MLKGKFRQLSLGIRCQNIERCCRIILWACVLHNISLKNIERFTSDVLEKELKKGVKFMKTKPINRDTDIISGEEFWDGRMNNEARITTGKWFRDQLMNKCVITNVDRLDHDYCSWFNFID